MGFTKLNGARALYGWTRLFMQPWRLAFAPTGEGWARVWNTQVWLDWGLWKTAAVYGLTLMALLAGFSARRGGTRADWAVLGAWAAPVILFALAFKGTDSERWIPIHAAFIGALLMWAGGSRPGRVRTGIVLTVAVLLVSVNLADRFGPRGSLESRPQMILLRQAAPHVKPGDIVYFSGELDEQQLNRTLQMLWLYPWVYETGAGVLDIWTGLGKIRGVRAEMALRRGRDAPGREFVCESVLADIPRGAPVDEGAEDRRDALMRRLPSITGLRRAFNAFNAGGKDFFQLNPDTAAAR
jgi:hypothetical protein